MLLGDTPRGHPSRDASRLEDDDVAGAPDCREQRRRHARRLSGAGRSFEDEDSIGKDGLDDLGDRLVDGESLHGVSEYKGAMLLQRDVPLAPLTTLGLGGRASHMAIVGDDGDLLDALHEAASQKQKVLVLGGGSNVVIADEGFDGMVVRVASRGVNVERPLNDKVRLDVAAGEDWDALVSRAVAEGWSGLESLSGIPGLVGATPIQNVGAYGHEVKETIASVRVFDRQSEIFSDLPPDACGFGYRTSIFRGSERYVVLRVVFELAVSKESAPVVYPELARALGVAEGGRVPSRKVRRAVRTLRRAKGMIVDPTDPDSASVGSFFVNPILTKEELGALERRAAQGALLRMGETVPSFAAGPDRWKIPAGWLVEHAGFPKGYGQGRVGVSSKHALALVHRGHGTTKEFVALAREIRAGVLANFGVTLEPEPLLVGCSL
jgi:UDP-N-acetylmuramate dehydrogenase